MSQLNKESNAYTLGFLAIMAVIVAVVLAFLAKGLEPTIKKNQEFDRKSKIVMAIFPGQDLEKERINTEYEKIDVRLMDHEGNILGEEIPADFDYRVESKKPVEEMRLPVYIYDADETAYVLQMTGMGLWDEISGYIALQEDKKTIRGVAFDHKGETPGLGAEIVKEWFETQFVGKQLFKDGEFNFTVYKAGKYDGSEYAVDGVSGATITTDGVDAMIESTVGNYSTFLNTRS